MKEKNINININSDTVFKRLDDQFLVTEVDGETVIMNIDKGTYWGFNNTTTEIWNLLKKPIPFGKIIEQLLNKFEVSEDTCKLETMKILKDLHRLETISIISK